MKEIFKKIEGLILPGDSYLIYINGQIHDKCLSGDILLEDNSENFDGLFNVKAGEYNLIKINNDSILKIFHIINHKEDTKTLIWNTENVNSTVYEYSYILDSGSIETKLRAEKNSKMDLFLVKEGYGELDYSLEFNILRNAISNVHNLNACKSSVKEKLTGNLLAEESLFKVYNVDLNSSGFVHRADILANHKIGNSKSRFSSFAIAKNESVCTINTLGIIENKASLSDMNHNIKGIILDDFSKINANPILDIEEFDVVASHGASVGDLSDDEIFYLMSRGLTLEESQRLILSGLVIPILDGFNDEPFNDLVNKLIKENL